VISSALSDASWSKGFMWKWVGVYKTGGSLYFSDVLRTYGFIRSMSRKAIVMTMQLQRASSALKTRHAYEYRYETRAEARQSIFEYIEIFYNRQRRHSALGYLSSVSFELEAMAA
jgi:putative transposase